MRCSKAINMLQLYVDDQLTPEQIQMLEDHVYGCCACRDELFLLEEIQQSLNTVHLIAEPSDLTANIMRRVALSPREAPKQMRELQPFALFRPSLSEILAAIVLATIAMLGIALEQPAVRAVVLPMVNNHGSVSLFLSAVWISLGSTNSETLMLGLWVVGTLLGVWITLIVAGSDIRNAWFRAIYSRLPVW